MGVQSTRPQHNQRRQNPPRTNETHVNLGTIRVERDPKLFRFPDGTIIQCEYKAIHLKWIVMITIPGEAPMVTTQPSIHYGIHKLGRQWFDAQEKAIKQKQSGPESKIQAVVQTPAVAEEMV